MAMTFDEAVAAALEIINAAEFTSEEEKLADFALHFVGIGDHKSLQVMIAAAALDQRLSYDALTRAAAELLIRGEALPPPLAEFAARALRAPDARPAVPTRFSRGWPGATDERDVMIYDLVNRLCRAGFAPSRNETSPPVSACDVVARAGALSGKCPSAYSTIWKIYSDVKKREKAGRLQRFSVFSQM